MEFEFAPCAVAEKFPVARLAFDVQRTAELLRIYSQFTSSRPAGRDGVTAYLFLSKSVNMAIISDVAPAPGAQEEANLEAFRELISPFLSLDPQVSISSTTLPELNSSSDDSNAAGRMCARTNFPQ